MKSHQRTSFATQAFVTPAGAQFLASKSAVRAFPERRHRPNRPVLADPVRTRRQATVLSIRASNQNDEKHNTNADSSSPKRPSWPKVALLTAGTALGTTFGINPFPSHALDQTPLPPTATTTSPNNSFTQLASSASNDVWSPIAVKSSVSASENTTSSAPTTSNPTLPRKTTNRTSAKSRSVACNTISLGDLGIKREDFLSDRELRRPKTTQFSEAEQELMELDEWEVDTQWFRNMQTMWAAVFSIGGIFVLYKGGVMWENWIKEQEQKDMEEEIKLTGKFVDPRAVRKDEDDDPNAKKKKKGTSPKKPSGSGDKPAGPTTDDQGGDFKQGDIESLEKLFGKS